MVDSRRNIRRLARTMQQRTETLPVLGVRFGQVASVVPGGAADGGPLVTVTVLATAQPMGYLDSYKTPATGDTVLVLSVLRYPIILGRIAGLPSF